MGNRFVHVTVFGVSAAVLGAIGFTLDFGRQDWAAWVQAVGATAGIGLAVWLPVRQRRIDVAAGEANRREMQKRICLAFHDELWLLLDRASKGPSVAEIMRDAPGEIFNVELPLLDNPFPVFGATIGKLVEVDDAAVRHAVIVAYEYGRNVTSMARMNNRRLMDLQHLHRQQAESRNPVLDQEIENQIEQLRELRSQMRSVMTGAIENISHAVGVLAKAIRALESP